MENILMGTDQMRVRCISHVLAVALELEFHGFHYATGKTCHSTGLQIDPKADDPCLSKNSTRKHQLMFSSR